MSRYRNCFDQLHGANEGALVPFTMVGDPSATVSLAVIDALIAGGADALELGIPFSDPGADGPVIQDAHLRATTSGVGVFPAFDLVGDIRAKHPDIPVGLLVYANLPYSMGLDAFYALCQAKGVDSVLVPDVPIRESAPFSAAAKAAGIDPVYIAPPSADEATLKAVAKSTQGYVYAVSRAGVTGTSQEAETDSLPSTVASLQAAASAPVLLGFGISRPEHVQAAIAAGAHGAITGSAVVQIIADHTQGWTGDPTADQVEALQADLTAFISAMKAATRR